MKKQIYKKTLLFLMFTALPMALCSQESMESLFQELENIQKHTQPYRCIENIIDANNQYQPVLEKIGQHPNNNHKLTPEELYFLQEAIDSNLIAIKHNNHVDSLLWNLENQRQEKLTEEKKAKLDETTCFWNGLYEMGERDEKISAQELLNLYDSCIKQAPQEREELFQEKYNTSPQEMLAIWHAKAKEERANLFKK